MAKGQKTEPALEEEVVAAYFACGSYRATARKFSMPETTVLTIVKRRAGDRLADLRDAMRADLIRVAFDKALHAAESIRGSYGSLTTPAAVGAARALADITRSISAIEPKEKDTPATPPTINVFTGMSPPPELAQQQTSTAVEAQDSTLPTGGGKATS